MDVRSYAGCDPELRLEKFFVGRTRASGLFVDRFGKLRRQFQLTAEGRLEDGTLVLDEHFTYGDGAAETRTWRIRPRGGHEYDARTDDLVGPASGAAYGNVVHLSYKIRLDLGGRKLPVRFDDWMFLQPDGVLINRANVSKYGILLGQVNCIFWREPAEAAATIGRPATRADPATWINPETATDARRMTH